MLLFLFQPGSSAALPGAQVICHTVPNCAMLSSLVPFIWRTALFCQQIDPVDQGQRKVDNGPSRFNSRECWNSWNGLSINMLFKLCMNISVYHHVYGHNDVLPSRSYKYGQLLYMENFGKLKLLKGKAVSSRRQEATSGNGFACSSDSSNCWKESWRFFPKNITNRGGPSSRVSCWPCKIKWTSGCHLCYKASSRHPKW